MSLRLGVWAALAFGSGCASNLSSLQTARTLDPGHVRVSTAIGGYVPLGTSVIMVNEGRKAVDRLRIYFDRDAAPYTVTSKDKQDLLTAGLSLAAFPPSPGYEVAVRAGVLKNLDAGFRYSVNALRLDAKYRFLHLAEDSEDGEKSFDIALGVGVSHYLFKNPVFELLELVQVDDFQRWDLEVPLYISQETGSILRIYAAPKYVFGWTKLDERLVSFSEDTSRLVGLETEMPSVVRSHFVGTTLGLALGYRWAHVWLEVTGGNLFCAPNIFGQRREIGGLTIYPAAGFSIEI